jgi:two-component system, LuxR family, sensor kinase FixL
MTNETLIDLETNSKAEHKLFSGSFAGWIAVTATFLFVPFIIWYITKTEHETYLNLVCDSAQAISSFLTFITAWQISKNKLLGEETQKAWQRLSLAFFSYFCGQFCWFYLSSVLGKEPFPSVADIGYAAFYPLMLRALRSFPIAPQTTAEKRQFWLDASIVMVSGFSVVWYFVIRPTIATGDEPMKIALNLIYVVGDMVLFLGIITILLKQPREISRRSLYAIIIGLLAISIADIGFAYYTLQNISPTGVWFDSFFTVSSYIMILAAYIQQRCLIKCSKDKEKVFQPAKFSWLPYIAVLVGYIMLMIVSQPYWTEPVGVFIFSAFIITGLVVLRQIASVRENIRLVALHSAQKSENKLRSLLENSSDITTVVDEKGYFEYISPAMEKFVGYSNKELEKTSMYRLVHPEDKLKLNQEYFAKIRNYGKNISLEYRIKHADGTWHDIDGIGQLFFNNETKTNSVLINARDATSRKANEARLIEYTKKLQLSNRELQDFAFVASHDLQEPLRKVQAFGDRLADKYSDKLGENGLDYLERMQSASRRMQTLINDLLTFSRVTTQAKPFVEFELSKVIADVISDLEVKIEDTKAEVNVKDLPNFEMDTTQMRQLFQNLIENGLKFSKPEISPVIKIWSEVNEQKDSNKSAVLSYDFTKTTELPQGFCRIYVEDNGIGFDEKHLDRIFTVFQRLHGRTEYEGSGIGLAVCRKIVERHNGHITAISKSGNGAKFIITLPLNQTKNGENNELKTDNLVSRRRSGRSLDG